MNIIDQLCAQSELTPEQQTLLDHWERADPVLGGSVWTSEDREECAKILQQNPDFRPTSIDLAKFGSVDGLLTRYDGLLARCVSEGLLTPTQHIESAKMARSGAISLGSVIREGTALKAWLDQATEQRAVEQEFSAAWPKKAGSAA